MSLFTIHNKHGDYLYGTKGSLNKMKKEVDALQFDAQLCKTYYKKSPWSNEITAHAKTIHRNYIK